MTVEGDLAQGVKPLALVEMFVFDPTVIGEPPESILRWHPGTTTGGADIKWQGQTYSAYPVEASGFEQTAVGKLPRPTIRASNIGGGLGAFIRAMEGGLGARITRKRTLGKYLDAVNFPGGNANADPNAHFDDEIFYLARKADENPIFVQFELAVAFDVAGIQLPRRQVIAATCQWVYRDPATCGYAGAAVLNDPVFPGVDKCGKTLTSCKLRFGTSALPFSGFPSSLLTRRV